jgi:hypothetical protein
VREEEYNRGMSESNTNGMRAQEVLVFSLRTMRGMIENMCKELTPAEMLHRPCDGANCAAWILGHLTAADHRFLTALGEQDVPALPEGFAARFATKGEAPKAKEFGDVSGLLAIFLQMRDRLIAATERTSAENLAEAVDLGSPRIKKKGEMLALAGFHSGLHAGHLSTIRRSLGKPALF